MERYVGTVVRGLRAPIINAGDDLVSVVTQTVLTAAKGEPFNIKAGDVLGITESIVARAQGNYASVDDIALDIKQKFPGEQLAVIFPILSRNRFSIILKGIARAKKKIYLVLNYPTDEVGNELVNYQAFLESKVNPYEDFSKDAFIAKFGVPRHPFTGLNYLEFYENLCKSEGCECEIILSNRCEVALEYTNNVLSCDIHYREHTVSVLKSLNANAYGLYQILNESVNGSGYNPKYGLLGSNKASEERVKLFPKDGQVIVDEIQKRIQEATGVKIEVMIYGDGAFKDPVGKIWELADPVVGVAYTSGLIGTPHEVKLKFLADNDFANLDKASQKEAIIARIREKGEVSGDNMLAQGTTPRQLTDLLGSLCDLTSGSGDKGTPLIYIQGYFDNYAN